MSVTSIRIQNVVIMVGVITMKGSAFLVAEHLKYSGAGVCLYKQ